MCWNGSIALVAILATLVSPSVCRARTAIVFGPEDPIQTVISSTYPISTVGRLQKTGGSYCTATLISDRHILTAAHCFVAQRDTELRAVRIVDTSDVAFLLNFRGGARRMPRLHCAGLSPMGPSICTRALTIGPSPNSRRQSTRDSTG